MTELEQKIIQARSALLASIKAEFTGPDEGDDITTENPVTRYAAGMLFPSQYGLTPEEEVQAGNEKETASTEESEVEDAAFEVSARLANSFFPSAMGISFYTTGNAGLKAQVSWTQYSALEPKDSYVKIGDLPEAITSLNEFKENFELRDGKLFTTKAVDRGIAKLLSEKTEDKNLHQLFYKAADQSQRAWINSRKTEEVLIGSEFKSQKLTEGLELVCERRISKNDNQVLFTIALKNVHKSSPGSYDEDKVYFNVSIKLEASGKEKEIFTEYTFAPLLLNDEEEQSLALLYRNKKTYAVGHGCAAAWAHQPGQQNAKAVHTEVLPTYEVPRVDFDIPGLDSKVLRMKYLSGADGDAPKKVIEQLLKFCEFYKSWIDGLGLVKDYPANLANTAKKHIKLCEAAYNRMVEGLQILSKDNAVMQAFQLANKSMLMQSMHSDMQRTKRLSSDEAPKWPDYGGEGADKKTWRPFQLAFLLLSVKGIADPSSDDRAIVDLVWFPTGGGKTEAYLALSAFTIFFRKLKKSGKDSGTTIMMRYTLRLLTQQQFQRACTLICAMEKIRRDNPVILGTEEISIGLWVGSESTPNTFKDAKEQFNEFIFGNSDKNPSPLLSCPWCGTKMFFEDAKGRHYAFVAKLRPERANLFCFEKSCPFNDRFPVLVVDEEIYDRPPTLLFGTVDKFAQMPWQKGVAKIFAADQGNTNNPPELIIQDELHLISGALGTMVGLYETAVDFLCSRKGIKPKIVASTATVRRAADQCKNLFNRDTRQFPPSGLDISDSYFSKEAPLDQNPGRLYVGLMPSGKTQTTASVRLTASLVHAVNTMPFEDEIKDKYWTLVSYFNSIRELGGFISLLNDDIQLYGTNLRQRYGGMIRDIRIKQELTSRKRAEEIPAILDQLSISYPARNVIDVLAATNMISVGVDIDRFGMMVIRGQPKQTSEYIQVSSRIGRRFPGIVITLYNPARTRDRAHYERFLTYHESFYRNVEPSSVTPFSGPARARALSAILVTMVRHGLGRNDLGAESGAGIFDPVMKGLDELRSYLYDRVKSIDSEEAAATMDEFEKLISDWKIFVEARQGKAVYKNEKQGQPLLYRIEDSGGGLWALPMSMRNVDADCNIDIKDE